MTQRFAVYVRRSRKDELEPGEKETSTEQQLRLCMDYAKRQGWTVPKQHVYDEGSGFSAYRREVVRAKFDEMVEAVQRRQVDGLLLWKVDRATRNSRDTARLAELHDDGVTIASVVEGAMTGMMLEWMGLIAKQQASDISVNSRRGIEARALSGRPAGNGPRRFGFEKDQTTVVPQEAELLQEAGRRALAGEGINTICRDFNGRGKRMADGKSLWQPTALRRLLLQPRTAGFRQHHGEVMKDADGDPVTLKDTKGNPVPPILDLTTWTRLGVVLRDPARRKPGHPVERELSGIPVCGSCRKGRFHGRKKDGKSTYVCSSKNIGCYSRIDGVGLEKYVTQAAIDWLCGDGLVRAREQLAKREADHEATKAQLTADEGKLLELADAFAADDIDMPSMLRARQPIEQRISRARAKLEQVPRLAVISDLPATRRRLTTAWRKMPVAQKRAILRAIIDKLVVGRGTPGRHVADKFDEDRVTLVFIDRTGPHRIGWPGTHDAYVRRMFKKTELPHETDEGVLDQVAREMAEE